MVHRRSYLVDNRYEAMNAFSCLLHMPPHGLIIALRQCVCFSPSWSLSAANTVASNVAERTTALMITVAAIIVMITVDHDIFVRSPRLGYSAQVSNVPVVFRSLHTYKVVKQKKVRHARHSFWPDFHSDQNLPGPRCTPRPETCNLSEPIINEMYGK